MPGVSQLPLQTSLRVYRLWEDDLGMRGAEGVLISSNETRE